MKIPSPTLIFATLLMFKALPCPADNVISKMVNSYRGATVFITAQKETNTGELVNESGTGFIISKDGYVVTSCHTVNRLILDEKGRDSGKVVQSVEIKGAVGSREGALEKLGFVTCAQPPVDLALLKFANTFKHRINIPIDRFTHLSIGDLVASMGYPLDVEFLPRRGTLGASAADGTFTVDMTMTHGDSGSPVFNEELKVVGVAEGGYSGTSIGFIRPITHAAGLLSIAQIEITATNANISSSPKADEPTGSKVEIATSFKDAIQSFSAAVGRMPSSSNSEVKVTYPILKLVGPNMPGSSGINSSSVAVSEIKAKAGYKIVDAKFIALDVTNAKVVSVTPSLDGNTARTAILQEPQTDSQPGPGSVRGFIETTQVPVVSLAENLNAPPIRKERGPL